MSRPYAVRLTPTDEGTQVSIWSRRNKRQVPISKPVLIKRDEPDVHGRIRAEAMKQLNALGANTEPKDTHGLTTAV